MNNQKLKVQPQQNETKQSYMYFRDTPYIMFWITCWFWLSCYITTSSSVIFTKLLKFMFSIHQAWYVEIFWCLIYYLHYTPWHKVHVHQNMGKKLLPKWFVNQSQTKKGHWLYLFQHWLYIYGPMFHFISIFIVKQLTHWSLGDLAIILKLMIVQNCSWGTCCEIARRCMHRNLLMISQHWIR